MPIVSCRVVVFYMSKSPVPYRLRTLRKEFGLSQMALGVSVGIDEASSSARISQYESGKHMMDFKTLRKFAEYFDVSTAYFYAESDELAALIRSSHLK